MLVMVALSQDEFDRRMREDVEFQCWFAHFARLVLGGVFGAARREVRDGLAVRGIAERESYD